MLTSGAIGLRGVRQYNEAADSYQQALTLAQEDGNQHDQAQALSGLGSCAMGRGDLNEAETYYLRALDVSQGRDARSAALTRMLLAQIALRRNDYPEAQGLTAHAHATLVDVGDGYDAARALALHGLAIALGGNRGDGAEQLGRALCVFEEAGSRFWQARTLEMLGQVAQEDDPDAAREHYQRAHDLLATQG